MSTVKIDDIIDLRPAAGPPRPREHRKSTISLSFTSRPSPTPVRAASKHPMPAPVAVQRRTVLIIATLAAFLTPFMSSAVNIALPSIAAEFDLDAVSLSLVASSYLFATVIFLAFAALCTPGIFASLARGSVRD